MADNIECPKCGKKTVVQRKEDLYECLSCDFKRDFSELPQQPKSNNGGVFWTTVVATIVALLFLQARDVASKAPKLEPQSFHAPITVQPTIN